MANRLQGRTAIVVGAAQGIGRGIAEVFLEEGARVVIADRKRDTGREAAKALGAKGEVVFTEADVGQRRDVEAVVDLAMKSFGRVDVLAQNAGIYPYTMIEAISVEEWDQVLGVNLRGCFLAAQACLAPMRAQGYGRMVFTSSITGPRVSLPGHGHYSASKAGINGFIRAAAMEFAPHGITVNGVEPGNIMTEGLRSERSPDYIRMMERAVPVGRLGTPRDVAYAFLYLASEEAAFVTGTTIVVDGGQILPESKA
jgi:3-oxoacyl-[acyl-carrier protein] reductase